MTNRQQFDNAMSQCGFGRDLPKKKPVRIAEIVAAHCVVVALIVALGFAWSHWA